MKCKEEQLTTNGTESPARNSLDAADSNNPKGARTMKNTSNNNTPEVDPVAVVADRLEVVEVGVDNLAPIPDDKNDTELRAVWKTELDFDTYTIEVTRDDEHYVTTDYPIPAVPPLTEGDCRRIREAWTRRILKGEVRKSRELIFTDDLAPVFDDVEKQIVHPATCANDGKCGVRSVGAEIEHASTGEGFKAGSFNVSAHFETITDQTDYRSDVYRMENMVVNVHGPVLHIIKGTVEDMRELGRFLVEQADRFQRMVDESEAVSL